MTADPTGTAPTSVALAVVVDRSGSMHSIAEDAEGGVNAFVAEQRAQPGGGRLLLTQFDDAFDVVVDWVPLDEAPEYSLAPRGRTALLDAWGRTVVLLEERLETTPVGERPERVVVVVVTDGLENASVDWTRKGVEELTKRKQERDGWQFVFLAAGQDAIATASALGIPAGASLTYDADGRGTRAAYAAASRWVSAARAGAPGAAPRFTEADRSSTTR